jgi:hypothetical protein
MIGLPLDDFQPLIQPTNSGNSAQCPDSSGMALSVDNDIEEKDAFLDHGDLLRKVNVDWEKVVLENSGFTLTTLLQCYRRYLTIPAAPEDMSQEILGWIAAQDIDSISDPLLWTYLNCDLGGFSHTRYVVTPEAHIQIVRTAPTEAEFDAVKKENETLKQKIKALENRPQKSSKIRIRDISPHVDFDLFLHSRRTTPEPVVSEIEPADAHQALEISESDSMKTFRLFESL